MKSLLNFLLLLSLLPASATGGLAQKQPGVGRKYNSVERMQPARLQAVRQDRLRFARERRSVKLKTGYKDYRAILHAHAEDASHTGGTRPEMLAAARRAGVSIIMLTDHVRPERDFINDSWRGLREGVLFIPGAEHEGFLVFPQASIRERRWKSREELIQLVTENGGTIFLSHIEERPDWQTGQLQGIEIYNHHSDIKDEALFNAWLIGSFTNAARLNEIVRALGEYPEEVFAAQQDYLADIIAKWDRDILTHAVTGVAANDCHHNQVFTVTVVDEKTIEVGYITSKPTTTRMTVEQAAGVAELTRGRRPGELIAKLDFDPYERSMNYVNTHILAARLDEATVRDALNRGHAYVAHDWLCDATGFAFIAEGKARQRVMGDAIQLADAMKLKIAAPLACTLKLIHNGKVIATAQSDHLEYEPKEKGAYRVEAWLEVDGEQRPWIYANPIYVR
jgi:hypothetical protein